MGKERSEIARKRHTPEQIIHKLTEVGLASGKRVAEVVCVGVTEQTYYRWRREYGGMKVSQARRLKELESMEAGEVAMNTLRRWLVWVDSDGVQDSEPHLYHGHDDNGGAQVHRSDGVFYRGIAPTGDEALDVAMREWRLAQNPTD